MNCPIAPLLLLLAVFSYQPLGPGADGTVAFDYTKDTEVKKLAKEAANDLAALVLKILEKNGKAELVKVDRGTKVLGVGTPSTLALVTFAHASTSICMCGIHSQFITNSFVIVVRL